MPPVEIVATLANERFDSAEDEAFWREAIAEPALVFVTSGCGCSDLMNIAMKRLGLRNDGGCA
jgi:hypothetical protein